MRNCLPGLVFQEPLCQFPTQSVPISQCAHHWCWEVWESRGNCSPLQKLPYNALSVTISRSTIPMLKSLRIEGKSLDAPITSHSPITFQKANFPLTKVFPALQWSLLRLQIPSSDSVSQSRVYYYERNFLLSIQQQCKSFIQLLTWDHRYQIY